MNAGQSVGRAGRASDGEVAGIGDHDGNIDGRGAAEIRRGQVERLAADELRPIRTMRNDHHVARDRHGDRIGSGRRTCLRRRGRDAEAGLAQGRDDPAAPRLAERAVIGLNIDGLAWPRLLRTQEGSEPCRFVG